jgi:hypothetical protein
MYECCICERQFKKPIIPLKCCKPKDDPCYMICKRCFNRIEHCPRCRSAKQDDLDFAALRYQLDHSIYLQMLWRVTTEQICQDIGTYLYLNPKLT